ncbi:hypothetical protein KM043_016973 [Ampulex compressa]|nr:hypothetical protein KM043_016973 [Ampulex compressa]
MLRDINPTPPPASPYLREESDERSLNVKKLIIRVEPTEAVRVPASQTRARMRFRLNLRGRHFISPALVEITNFSPAGLGICLFPAECPDVGPHFRYNDFWN